MIVDVFMAWRRGQLVTPSQAAVIQQSQITELVQATLTALVPQLFSAVVKPAIEALAIQVAEVKAGIEKAETSAASSMVSKSEVSELKQKARTLASLYVQIGQKPTFSSALQSVNQQSFGTVGWCGPGKRHDLLPKEFAPRVRQILDSRILSAREIAVSQLKKRQLELIK